MPPGIRAFACSLLVVALACSASSHGSMGSGNGDAAGAGASGRTGSVTQSGGAGAAAAGSVSVGNAGQAAAAGRAGASAAQGSAAGRSGAAGGLGATGGANAGKAGTNGTAGLGAAGASGVSGTGAVDGSAILAPAQGVLLGQYYGAGDMAASMAKLGRVLPIHLVYWAFRDDWTGGSTKADLTAGRIPLVNWEPANINFNDIVSGSLDATINARASGAKALGQKFFLDFAAEMNGDEAWSGNDAPLYVSAYKHIHDLFAAAGASNVVWAFCPNVTDTNGGNSMTLAYYPGDDYVDWTCVDGYNWGSSNGDRWQSFQEVFTRIYPILAGKGKPIMIGEMASAEVGGDKAQWIDQMVPALRDSFPMIKALVWFDVNKETDWRISSSPASEAAFKRLAADPYCNP